ncbi:MAG: GntR family transcriptional regulator [Granulosicoccus sp.]
MINGWMDVRTEVLQRLQTLVWKPGELLPGEADLAAEFGCARTTVNRALQAIADEGLLERKRRGGTRVVVHPERKATFSIPIIRLQIEEQGLSYRYRLLRRRVSSATVRIRDRMQVSKDSELLCLRAVHTANRRPYVLENRWIDCSVVPEALEVDFTTQSANEWLVENVPFSGGELVLTATAARGPEAAVLECDDKAGLFNAERLTRNAQGATITLVQLVYAPGYRMKIDV